MVFLSINHQRSQISTHKPHKM